MIRSALKFLAYAAVLVAAASPVPSALAQARASQLHLLDVPYLPQSESLCGGAAAAMVMRYWGAANVYAETFSDLVDPAAGGIHGSDLIDSLRSRGWSAQSFRGDPLAVQTHLAARRPVIALIQDRPGRFHYVVIVGWSGGRVIVHDPARAPFRVLDERDFETAWAPTDHWALVAMPEGTGAAATPPAPATNDDPSPSEGPCGAMIDEGVRLAGTGDTAAARRLLEIASATCPNAAGPWREMAGLHALEREWFAAAADARRALARDPGDPLAARILATSLYLTDDPDGALKAWNRVGEPIVDLVNITGLERTRYPIAARAMGLAPQMMLTPEALAVARRRLAELPSAQVTRVGVRPGENGRTQVDAIVLERPAWPNSRVALAATGLRALTDREAAVTIASPTGGGESWTASWRWWEHRPKAALRFDAPDPFGGVWGASLSDERQSYAGDGGPIEESRRRAEFHVSDWTFTGLRWEGTVGIDRFGNTPLLPGGKALALAASVEQRFLGDHASADVRTGVWAGGIATWAMSLRTEWRSATRNEGTVWIARAGQDVAASNAPLALWPGAGTGPGRDALLRAHPLLDDGIVERGAFGRRLAHGGFEWRRWVQPARKPVHVAPALFVDAARASHGLPSFANRWQADAGIGLRLAVPGSGVWRIDLAHGLRDGRTALSIGWGR